MHDNSVSISLLYCYKKKKKGKKKYGSIYKFIFLLFELWDKDLCLLYLFISAWVYSFYGVTSKTVYLDCTFIGVDEVFVMAVW